MSILFKLYCWCLSHNHLNQCSSGVGFNPSIISTMGQIMHSNCRYVVVLLLKIDYLLLFSINVIALDIVQNGALKQNRNLKSNPFC